MKNIINRLYLVAALLPLACGGTEQGPGAKPASTAQTLSAVGACSFAACGSMPSNLASTPSVECSGPTTEASESCAWSASDPDSSVSYRPCAAAECPAAPAIDCPAGTVHSTQQCGSENDAACTWTTVCTPPRSTTPCEGANACGPQPELGVICQDGSTGALVCVTNGEKCGWERSCD